MKQITIRQLVRQANEAKLREWSPCIITSDGNAIVVLLPIEAYNTAMSDIEAYEATKSDKLTELPYSKHKQVKSRWQ